MFNRRHELFDDPANIRRGQQLLDAFAEYRQDHYSEEFRCFEPSVPIEAPNVFGSVAAFVGENQLDLDTMDDLEPDLFRRLGTNLTRDMLLYMTAERARRQRENSAPVRRLLRDFRSQRVAAESLFARDEVISRMHDTRRMKYVRQASGLLIRGSVETQRISLDGGRSDTSAKETTWVVRLFDPEGEPLVRLAISEPLPKPSGLLDADRL